MIRLLVSILLLVSSLSACAGEPPSVGSVAPDFRLQDQNGDWHELKDYRGKWLAVYFYPRDDTPGCTTEACSFRDNIFAFRGIGAEVVGISVDDVDSHKDFATKYKLPFTILSDSGGQVSDAYGVLRDYKMVQIASRQSFLVNPDGIVVKHYADVDPDDHTEQVLADLKSLMAEDKPASG